MTKKTILFILLSAVVLVGGLYFLKSLQTENQANENNSEEISEETNDINTDEQAEKKMAFSEFVKNQKDSYKCEVDQYLDEGFSQKTTGTVFLNDGKIRGNYKVAVQGMNIDASVIVRDEFVYAWTSMAPFGTKSKVNTNASGGNEVKDLGGNYTWDDKLIGDYQCESWSVDNSVFELPAGVEFREV